MAPSSPGLWGKFAPDHESRCGSLSVLNKMKKKLTPKRDESREDLLVKRRKLQIKSEIGVFIWDWTIPGRSGIVLRVLPVNLYYAKNHGADYSYACHSYC
jgi:hypothetical protein